MICLVIMFLWFIIMGVNKLVVDFLNGFVMVNIVMIFMFLILLIFKSLVVDLLRLNL